MCQVDYTTTATCRPELLQRTLESFRELLRGNRFELSTLYLNIDPVPQPDLVIGEIRVAEQFFGRVVVNSPEEACFPAAVKWCWSQPTTEFFFHLEDDWTMARPFQLEEMIDLLRRRGDLSCVNLRAYPGPLRDERICLCPGLLRTADAKILASRLTTTANPEKQLRPVTEVNPEGGKQYPFIGIQVPQGTPILHDIGRAWLRRSGWKKEREVFFTKWTKVGS